MNKFVAVVGMCGAGKSEVADILVDNDYQFLRFGQITMDIVKEKGLEPTEENEKKIREEVREEHGMGAYAILNVPKIDGLLEKGSVVGDGLYSWSEYKVLKDKYGDRLTVLAVYSPPKTRYERLDSRELESDDKEMRNRRIPPEKAKSRDYAEIENIEKGGPIAMADYTIKNIGSIEELRSKVEKFLEWVNENGR